MPHLEVFRFPARNVPALLRHTTARCGSRRFIREISSEPQRHLIEWTYEQFEHAVAATAEYLASLGIKPFDRVLFVAENSSDYQVLSLAVQALRAEPCAVFSSLNASTTCDIARRVRPRCVFVSSSTQWEKLDAIAAELIATGLSLRISPVPLAATLPNVTDGLSSIIAETPFVREEWDRRVDSVEENDPFLLLFTSGTSGKQKGVILRQNAFVYAIEGGGAATGMSESDDGLMFLPFAHIAGQCQFMLAIALGHSLILAPRREDISTAFTLGPTYAFAVPMVYEKLLAKVAEQLENKPWPLRQLLSSALADVTESPANQKTTWKRSASTFLVKTVLGKRVKHSLGGRIRMLASGGASAPPSLGRFFETLGIPFLSLYGMSETSGLICSQSVAHERDEGSVGLPSPDLELKIAENGELRVKGLLLMASYLDPEDAVEAMDDEGYFRTGDLVVRDPNNGQYHIVGRSKNLLVLSTGKKISPEPVETALEAIPPLTGVVVVGDGRPYVAALLFVYPKSLRALGPNEPTILTALDAIVNRALVDISEFERPKRFLVIPGSPSDWSEFVTPTLKLKRAPIIAAHELAIERLYRLESGSGFILPT